MNFMDRMGAFGGLFGIIFSIIQTIIQLRQTKKQELLQQLQQQYQEEMNSFNTAYSQVTGQIQMDNQYAYQYHQQNVQQNNQLFEGGAGNNPTQAGTDHLQEQAAKSAKLATIYKNLTTREKKLRNQLLTMRSQETAQYNAYEQQAYSGNLGYGSLMGNEFSGNGLDSFKNVSSNVSDTINGWLNDVSQAAANVQQDSPSSLTAAYLQMQQIYKQINAYMTGNGVNGYYNTTVTDPTAQEINQNKGDLWNHILNVKKENIKNTLTMKTVERENFGMWKPKTTKNITRMGTRRVKP